MENFTRQDKLIIRALQEDFPLCAEPYKILAQRAGMTEEDFLRRVRELVDEKKIRRMGAVLRHREIGFKANALCAWHVPPENLDAVAKIMTSNAAVSHCYDRTPAQNWNYNLYTMIHAKTRDECEKIIGELASLSGVTDYKILYTKREWKKTGMKYFCE